MKSKNILLIVGSPKNKKGNSESLIDYLKSKMDDSHQITKVLLRKEINHPENLIRLFNEADDIVISYPIYQNSFPGLVLQMFELLAENKELLEEKQRKIVVISNSGFPEVRANTSSITQCKLFTEQMKFSWGAGIIVAPGAMIGENNLEEAGKTYEKIRTILEHTAKQMNTDDFSDIDREEQHVKPLINPSFYRIAGRLLQNKVIKKLGKEKYYQKPFC